MTVAQLMPWIGGPVKFEAAFSPLICPIDDTVASHVIESDAKVVDAAVKHAHAAFLKHQDATTAKRVEWLLAAAEAIDKIEGELVRSVIRFIGKPARRHLRGQARGRLHPRLRRAGPASHGRGAAA